MNVPIHKADYGLLDLASVGILIILISLNLSTSPEIYSDFASLLGYIFMEPSRVDVEAKAANVLAVTVEAVMFGALWITPWFLVLLAFGLLTRDVSLTIHEASFLILSLSFWYVLSLYGSGTLDLWTLSASSLIVISLWQTLKGLGDGLIIRNRLNPRAGDWRGIIRGMRIALIALIFLIPSIYIGLYRYTITTLGPAFSPAALRVLPIIEFGAFIILLTWIPLRFIFVRCPHCKSLILKVGVPISSWDSEHTLRHRHCPRCGSTIDL